MEPEDKDKIINNVWSIVV